MRLTIRATSRIAHVVQQKGAESLIIFNAIAFVELAIAFGFVLGVDAIFDLGSGGQQGLCMHPVVVLLDLGYRLYGHEYRRWQDLVEDTEWLTDGRRGGSLFYIPAWIAGSIFTIVSLVMVVKGSGN